MSGKGHGGRLTTHVLDTAEGRPASGMRLTLARIEGADRRIIGRFRTNADGRADAPLLSGEELRPGAYEILFHVGDWQAAHGAPGAGFYEEIPIRFRVADPHGHYHVPLILSPFGYSTYRGELRRRRRKRTDAAPRRFAMADVRTAAPGDDPLRAFAEGRMSKEWAIRALGFCDYAQLLMALGDAGLHLPRLPEEQVAAMQANFVRLLGEAARQ